MSRAGSETREAWALAAAAWERHRDLISSVGAPVTTRLLELLDPKPGETILEIACGTGDVGLALAPRLEDGSLIQSDLVPEMVDAARREAHRRGVINVSHVELDAEQLALDDASVDGVVCRWGYMLVPEPVRALAETRRVLRPEGRVALAVWAESTRNPWATTIGRILVELGFAEPPDPDAPGPFRLGDRELLLDAIRRGGLEPHYDGEVAVEYRTASTEAFWDAVVDLSTTLRSWLHPLTEEELATVREEVDVALAAYADGGAIVIPGSCRIVLARPAS